MFGMDDVVPVELLIDFDEPDAPAQPPAGSGSTPSADATTTTTTTADVASTSDTSTQEELNKQQQQRQGKQQRASKKSRQQRTEEALAQLPNAFFVLSANNPLRRAVSRLVASPYVVALAAKSCWWASDALVWGQLVWIRCVGADCAQLHLYGHQRTCPARLAPFSRKYRPPSPLSI